MPNQSEALFPDELLQRHVFEILNDESPIERLSIAYVGPALKLGRMDAILLADGLKGTARFVNRVAEMHLGSTNRI
jgi:hypothetical protein